MTDSMIPPEAFIEVNMRRVPEATVQSDYDLLLARVASGELGAGNLVEMILNEQSKNAALVTGPPSPV